MLVKEKSKAEVEAKAGSMSDFLKMEYLEECLKGNFSFDIKRFCNLNLAKIYEGRNMFSEAAKKMDAVGEISVTFREKKEAYMKAVELFIKGEYYDKADFALRKALDSCSLNEKKEIKTAVAKLLKEQAGVYEKENKRGKAVKAYGHLYRISEEEKAEIKQKLLDLYSKLGMMREFNMLRGS